MKVFALQNISFRNTLHSTWAKCSAFQFCMEASPPTACTWHLCHPLPHSRQLPPTQTALLSLTSLHQVITTHPSKVPSKPTDTKQVQGDPNPNVEKSGFGAFFLDPECPSLSSAVMFRYLKRAGKNKISENYILRRDLSRNVNRPKRKLQRELVSKTLCWGAQAHGCPLLLERCHTPAVAQPRPASSCSELLPWCSARRWPPVPRCSSLASQLQPVSCLQPCEDRCLAKMSPCLNSWPPKTGRRWGRIVKCFNQMKIWGDLLTKTILVTIYADGEPYGGIRNILAERRKANPKYLRVLGNTISIGGKPRWPLTRKAQEVGITRLKSGELSESL